MRRSKGRKSRRSSTRYSDSGTLKLPTNPSGTPTFEHTRPVAATGARRKASQLSYGELPPSTSLVTAVRRPTVPIQRLLRAQYLLRLPNRLSPRLHLTKIALQFPRLTCQEKTLMPVACAYPSNSLMSYRLRLHQSPTITLRPHLRRAIKVRLSLHHRYAMQMRLYLHHQSGSSAPTFKWKMQTTSHPAKNALPSALRLARRKQ